MEITHNPFGWIEIPVANMERAIKFYETVFSFKMERHQMGPLDMAWFPSFYDKAGAAGTLVYHAEWYKPSTDGVLVYITAFSGDLDTELARVEAAGGKVLQPKTLITPEIGHMAMFLDTEGNRVAMHSLK